MVFQGCSDVVESRVEHLFSMPNAAGMQLLLRIVNSPRALALRVRTSDNASPRRAGLSIDECVDLSIDRDQREKVKPGELEQLPESKKKINHPVAMLQFRSLPKY
jgi:hypothetical protein